MEALHSLRKECDAYRRESLQAMAVMQNTLDDLKRQNGMLTDMVRAMLDSMREQRVLQAVDSGRATTDFHYQHLELAQTYKTLVRQSLRSLGRELCPTRDGESPAERTRRRAEAVGGLVPILFEHLGRYAAPPPPEGVITRLRAMGLAVDGLFRAQFAQVYPRVAALHAGVAKAGLAAELEFGVDLSALPANQLLSWELEGDCTRPEFLVAPAYRLMADPPVRLSPPIVFAAPVAAP
ncbi:hypothetical protein EES37_36605 [Streptomyces sp. ADI91-18]|nr:hypothetical protein EES37_36605 [Streptomyces sp. ADI91-18]